MLRKTLTSLKPGNIPVYHRKALPLAKNRKWYGNFGAIGRWHGQIGAVQPMTESQSLQNADREMMLYLHDTRLRHKQLRRSYSQIGPSAIRTARESDMWQRKQFRYLAKSFNAFMQYETRKVLQDQAGLVTRFGQVAVNQALGDSASPEFLNQRATAAAKRVATPPPARKVPRHVLTMKQKFADRFNRHFRLS